MNCPKCNQVLTEGSSFCIHCGASLKEAPKPETVEAPAVQAEPIPQPAVVYTAPVSREVEIPRQYTPLKPGHYFWLQILFSIPVIGFIFLIVFSCSSANLNRRNFARSYWCWLIAWLVIAVVVLVVFLLLMSNGSINSDIMSRLASL